MNSQKLGEHGGSRPEAMTMHYGSVETGEGARGRGAEGAPARGVRHTMAALLGLWALALVLAMVAVTVGVQQRTVLDDKVDDPLAGLDETVHKWTDTHADGYNPEKQNVLNDKDAFEVPFVGYADKDLKWAAPSEPETNVLDYLPTVSLAAAAPPPRPPSPPLFVFACCAGQGRWRSRAVSMCRD